MSVLEIDDPVIYTSSNSVGSVLSGHFRIYSVRCRLVCDAKLNPNNIRLNVIQYQLIAHTMETDGRLITRTNLPLASND